MKHGNNLMLLKIIKYFVLNNEYFGMSANFNYQKGLEDLEGILYENN